MTNTTSILIKTYDEKRAEYERRAEEWGEKFGALDWSVYPTQALLNNEFVDPAVIDARQHTFIGYFRPPYPPPYPPNHDHGGRKALMDGRWDIPVYSSFLKRT